MLHVFSRFTLLVPLSKRASSRTPLLPLLRHPRSLTSQVLSSGDLETNRARTNPPTLSVSHPLDQEKNEEAANSFKNRLTEIPSEDSISRFNAYEARIKSLLNQKLYKNAIELYQQMCAEGIHPPSGLRARMLVCSDIVTAPHERENLEYLYKKLSRVLSLSSYSELSLRKLLGDMLSHPLIDSQFVSKLVDVYVKSKGPTYKLKPDTINQLIMFYTHAGNMDMVESLVLPRRESADDHPRHTDASPYTTLISALTKKGAMSSTHIGLILDEIKQSHIPVDLPFMNALVQSAVRRGNLHQAFSFYEDILKDPASHMIPDSFTFGTLFNALQSMWAPRSRRPRRIHPPPNAPTPRRLFRQMLECHVLAIQAAADADRRNTGPEVRTMRVSTLNAALRLFLLSMDYPAAFVVLQTFRGLDLRPDARTYRFVLTILLGHVKANLRQGQSRRHDIRWAISFLGGGGPVDVRRSEDIRPELISAFLEFARACGETQFRVPDFEVIMGDEKEPENAEWDIEPLERLVVRAILARMPPKARSVGEAERAVREKLAPVFYELVPDRLWKGRRLRRAAY